MIVYYLTKPSPAWSWQYLIGWLCVGLLIYMFIRVSKRVEIQSKTFFHIKSDSSLPSNVSLDSFRIFVAPASGPRCFTTMGFDRKFRKTFQTQSHIQNKWLVGGSTAALRFTALISSIITKQNRSKYVQQIFTEMTYQYGDTPDTLSPMMEKLIQTCAPESLISKIVHHPYLHLCIFVTRLKYPVDISDWKLKLSFGAMCITNLFYPRHLEHFYDTICFYTGSPPH